MPLYRVLLPHYDSDRYPYITTGRGIMPDYVRMRHLPVRALEHYDHFSMRDPTSSHMSRDVRQI